MHLLLFPHQLFGTFPAPLAKRMSKEKLAKHLKIAENFLKRLD